MRAGPRRSIRRKKNRARSKVAGGLIETQICTKFVALENSPDPLNLGEIGTLMMAIAEYGLESDKCEAAGAHLASSIMLAATIEGYLTICVSTFPNEADAA